MLPQIYIFNEINYHHADDIYDMDCSFFNKINKSRNIRDIVKHYNVPNTEYIYAKYKDNLWIPDKITNKRAKLFISTQWTYNNVPQFILFIYNNKNNETKGQEDIIINNTNSVINNNTVEDNDTKENIIINNDIEENEDINNDEKYEENITSNNTKEDENIIINNNMKENEDINITAESKYEYLPVPERIILEEHEVFKDNEGIPYNVIMVGKRHVNECYFNVKNISEIFELPNLDMTLLDMRFSTYVEDLHYKYFVIKKSGNPIKKVYITKNRNNYVNKTTKKELYLTYNGLIVVLFNSRTGRARDFQNWTLNILFTHQFGTNEEKQQLSADLINVNVKILRSILDKSTSALSCIYMFKLGTCKDLRQSFNIPFSYNDDLILCKYGRTNNLSRRTLEHNDTFKKYKLIDNSNVIIDLIIFTLIDNAFTSDAETELKTFVSQFSYNYDTLEELIIINNTSHLKLLNSLYDTISLKYAGQHEKLISDIKILNNIIEQQEINIKHLKEQYEKDIIIIREQYENKLLKEQYENKLLKEHYENKLLQQELKLMKELHKQQQDINEYKLLLLSNNINIQKNN